MGDSHVGLQARLMSQALRKLTGTISKSNTLVIFINQIRMKIGVMFGNPETTTGGNALKFYASVRLDIRRVGALKDGDKVVGNRTRVKVVKNKMAPPFREVEFDILYGEGISHEGDLVDLGAECGAIEKSGAWFGFEGDRIGQGRENAKQYLRDHADVARKIETKVLAHHGIKRDVGGPALAGGAGGGVGRHRPHAHPAAEAGQREARALSRRGCHALIAQPRRTYDARQFGHGAPAERRRRAVGLLVARQTVGVARDAGVGYDALVAGDQAADPEARRTPAAAAQMRKSVFEAWTPRARHLLKKTAASS